MTRYGDEWVAALASAVDGADGDDTEALLLLYVVTDTEDGKVAFNLSFEDGRCVAATAGKLPRGTKADVTVTAKEAALLPLWAGERSRDAAFMAGDLKIEGAYERWLDELVPRFVAAPWAEAWATAAT
jgi:putative sterol carrier protein